MASISKIRYTNVIYEDGSKRYNDEVFQCAGHNTAVLLENGGGKTVFIQTALQAILPHTDLGERKVKETYNLEGEAAHIAIEWILQDKPRRYALTAVTLYLQSGELKSYKYVYEYQPGDKNSIENLPFTQKEADGKMRPSSKGEVAEYYQKMSRESMVAKSFVTTKEFQDYIEQSFKIVPDEWRSIAVINKDEGGVEGFFEGCKTTKELVEKLLLPTIEQALAGKGSEDFASTFESQKEHFKKHKQLSASVEDSRKVKAEISSYVGVYKDFDNKSSVYELKKVEIKALYAQITKLRDTLTADIEESDQQLEENKQEYESLIKKEKLCELTQIVNVLEQAEKSYNELLDGFNEQKLLHKKKSKRLYDLKISRYKNTIQQAQANIDVLESQLQKLDANEEIEDIKQQLEENGRMLKGYYEAVLETNRKKKTGFEIEYKKQAESLEELKAQREAFEQQKKQLEQQRVVLIANVDKNNQEMDKIRKAILSQSEHEQIEELNEKWQQRVAYLEQDEVALYQQIKELEQRKDTLEASISNLRDEQSTLIAKVNKIEEKLLQNETAQQQLIALLKTNSALYSITSIYTKQQQIISTLEEQMERAEKEKEELLDLERRHSRFIENYQDNAYFTAEPLLYAWVTQWKYKFSFLQAGTEFVKSFDTVDDSAVDFSKWAQLVVVSDGQEETLIKNMNAHKEQLTTAVEVISLSRAKALLENKPLENEQTYKVYPAAWQDNMDKEQFEYNKTKANEKLAEVRVKRKERENKYRELREMLNAVQHFLNNYPYEEYMNLKADKDNTSQQLLRVKEEIETSISTQKQLQLEIDAKERQRVQQGQEKITLENRLQELNRYIGYKRECEQYEQEKSIVLDKLESNRVQLQQLEKRLREVTEALEDLTAELSEVNVEIARVLDDELYKEVQQEQELYTNQNLYYLKETRKGLMDILLDKQKGRSQLESELKLNKDKKTETEESLEMERQANHYEIEQVVEFTSEVPNEIHRLIDETNKIKKTMENLDQRVIAAKKQYDQVSGQYIIKQQDFVQVYGALEKLTGDVEIVKKEIEVSKEKNHQKNNYLNKRKKQLENEQNEVEENMRLLQRKDEVYQYLSLEVADGIVADQIIKELNYSLKKIVSTILDEIEKLKQQMLECRAAVEVQKEYFRSFCEQNIRDTKLKNMAIQGIMQKQQYEELAKWEDNMVTRINHTIDILQKDMLEQDKQVVQFIIHLYTYLRTVCAELEEIPKKTRVKTEEGWKTIYEIVVPKWNEEDGKDRIRGYIYELLGELEKETFLNSEGEEDIKKVKKYIRDQFRLKQLMELVLGNDVIKVKCCKVSSIKSISSQRFPWEFSTKWSGGEKWSKNMSLYLGILNYLAEKRQNIHSDSGKVHRVVILDNPFGKASSGHVLDPVFFIAQQLGFQIIALTAHAEGDFIRKYFPIVYSCKLRYTKDYTTSILTKEQEIKKAFFEDNDPAALSVLTTSNQLSLF